MTSPKQGMERHLLNWTFETVHLLPDITRACGPWALSRCMVVLAARGPCPERTPGLTPQTVPSTSCHWNDCLHPPRCPPRSTEDHTASHGSFLSVWQICLCNRACRMCWQTGYEGKCYRQLPGFLPHQLSAWWCHLPRCDKPAGLQIGGRGLDFYLYKFPVAAVTAYQQPDSLKQQQFILSWFWVPAVQHYSRWARVTVWAGCAPLA